MVMKAPPATDAMLWRQRQRGPSPRGCRAFAIRGREPKANAKGAGQGAGDRDQDPLPIAHVEPAVLVACSVTAKDRWRLLVAHASSRSVRGGEHGA